MEWLEPWWFPENRAEEFNETFTKQLEREVPPGHCMYGLPVRLIARGSGDDSLFAILDGSGRVADVHLTWSKRRERLPWPVTSIFQSLEDWIEKVMLPEHKEWTSE